MNGEPSRRPGGAARLLLLACVAVGFFAVFSVGFPPAARDRLPVLVLAMGLALLAAWSPARGLLAFSLLFPLSGIGDRVFGGADAIAWPVLLFAGFAAGWTFRFLYDFENAPDPSRLDGALRAVAALWLLATLLAFVRARTLWAFGHGLQLRAVNVEGLLDGAALRDSLLSFASLAVGVGYFFILRRSSPALRSRALLAALTGCALSGAAALLERFRLAPQETSDFWRMTGRLSGGAIDPNALGMACALALVVVSAWLLAAGKDRGRPLLLAAALAAGLVLSGSRSGLVVVGVGLATLAFAPGLPARRRLALAGIALAGVLVVGGLLARDVRGSVASRFALFFDPSASAELRVSARTVLWQSAWRLFEKHPVTGAGLGAFSWQLPNLLAEQGRALPLRDNPGNAYLQALAETGAVGFLLTILLAAALARESAVALSRWNLRPLEAGSGAAILGFLAALLSGSHWFAPDVSLLFFLLAALASRSRERADARSVAAARALLLAVYAAGAFVAALGTASPEEAFRYRQAIGFHGKEPGHGGLFYWTRRRFALRLRAGETRRLTLAHYTPEGRPVELVAVSDGRDVLRRTLAPGDERTFLLSARAKDPRVIEFSVSRAFIPKRLGLSGDRRELGLVSVFPP